jgi:RimJ/RimL family protein N-acetyltransferase
MSPHKPSASDAERRGSENHAIASIVTSRLILRPPSVADYDNLAALWTDPSLLRYIGRPSTPEEVWVRLLKYSGHWALFGFGYWMVREADTETFIGEAGVAWQRRTGMTAHSDLPEAGWMLTSSAQGKGFAREALAAVLDWTLERLEHKAVTCLIDPKNEPSLRLAASQGFKKFGTTRIGETIVDEFVRQ